MKYKIIPPAGQDEWWNITDTEAAVDSPYVVSVFARLAEAEQLTRHICDRLNRG
jgi:hypothetical protein